MIISGGENVYPGEVEAALGEHPDVGEIALVGAEDERSASAPAAFVVPADGSDLTEAELWRLRRRSSPATRCRGSDACKALPRNALGKILKRQLR